MYEDLFAFVVIVEESSLNKASKLLNLSQPALSRKVAKLEDDLGAKLFARKGKRLELTETGQEVYAYALEQRSRHQHFLQSISRLQPAAREVVTLGASLTTIQTTLPLLVKAFMNKNPDTDLKLITGKTHEIVSQVKDSKLDFGVIASQVDEPGLGCTPLFQDHLELVVPRQHELAVHGKNAAMQDLDGLPMIIFSKGTWYRRLVDELVLKYAITPDTRMEIDSFEAIVRLLPICRAASLLPRSYLRPQLLRDNELVAVPLKELLETQRATCLIYPHKSDDGIPAPEWAREVQEQLQSNLRV